MALRCFLFSSDEGTAAILRQILSGLGVEGEFSTNPVSAVERITNQPFQIVIIDWDQQPEAGLLLNTARERKAAERPLTLAIVSNDGDAPKALHAGANSLLRKPIIASQASETLTTARDLLRSKQGPSAAASAAGRAPVSAPVFPVVPDQAPATSFRAGEFLQSATVAPGGLIETETPVPSLLEQSADPVAPVQYLESVASSVAEEREPAPAPLSQPTGTRGLEWYLRNRAPGQVSGSSAAAPAPAPVVPAAPNPARGNPELLGFDQSSSYSPRPAPPPAPPARETHTFATAPKPLPTAQQQRREQKKESELFAYIDGEKPNPSQRQTSSGFRFAKRALIPALALAAIAIVAAPQAPWHPRLQILWRSGRQALHAWLNPEPVTPAQAQNAHETFTRAGDEYKLPVAEAIPDATTDPSQIRVLPVIDPTIKKTNPEGANAMDPSAVPQDGSAPPTDAPDQNPAVQVVESQPTPANSDPFRPAATTPASQPLVTVFPSAVAARPDAAATPAPAITATPKATQPQPTAAFGTIPSSLRSQLAPATPAPAANKPLNSAPAAIEPVAVPETAERALITENLSPAYPATARGQQGTVVLQVLIGRDGTVQDAKFMQGSLIFARNAIDAVKQWKFRPYSLNGRPVSVQTQLTLKFKP